MAKTADVLKSIWADPWFLALPPDGKLLFLWGITNEHSNMAGLYVVAEETILHETKLTPQRFKKALEVVHPKMGYRPESGTVCVPSRPKHARMKTDQIRTSILQAVENCPHPEIQSHYVARYRTNRWLGDHLVDLALELGLGEPQQGSTNLSEVPSHSQSQSHVVSKGKGGSGGKGKPADPSALPDGADPALAASTQRCLPVLQRTADARGAKPVTALAVYRAIESYPTKRHAEVAGEVEHWTVHGNGANKAAKDIVARFRNFLADAPDQPQAVQGVTGSRMTPEQYEASRRRHREAKGAAA